VNLRLRDVRTAGTARNKSERAHFVLGPVSLDVAAGETVALLGPTGSGKSLLLRALAGLLPVQGECVVESPRALVFQRDALLEDRTVHRNVSDAARACGIERADDAARDVLERVGLEAHVDKRPSQLSGGMRKRVGIARALVVNPRVLLCDDPTAGLDPGTSRAVLGLLRTHAPTAAIVIATHDVDVALAYVDRVLWLGPDRTVTSCAVHELVRVAPAFAPRPFSEALWQAR
jgi:ABC-type nitrate/sulfonate/bicarbonate transport system ATPase subunit